MSQAYGPNASSFLENAFKPKPQAAVLIVRHSQSLFTCIESLRLKVISKIT